MVDHNTGHAIEIKDNNEFGANYVSIHERGYDTATGARVFGNPTAARRRRFFFVFVLFVCEVSSLLEWCLISFG